MTIRIVSVGKRPENREVKGQCGRCKTECEWVASDGKANSCQRDGEWNTIPCPVCGRDIIGAYK